MSGETLTDTFTATTVDGTQQLVTITINGTNDAAVISGDVNGAVIEAGGVDNGTPGTPDRDRRSELDRRRQYPNDAWTAVGTATASTKGYGTYTLTAAGLWTYTLDNSNADVQARNVGQILSDTFTVFDGRRHFAGRHHHHQRHQRRRRHHRRHDRDAWSRPAVSITARRARRPRPATSTPPTSTIRTTPGRRSARRPQQRLRQLHADSGRPLDLHAGQQQCRRAGAQCRADADRHVHRHHGRRHRPAGDHHHQRRQRRAQQSADDPREATAKSTAFRKTRHLFSM